jgi:hypothetical protein
MAQKYDEWTWALTARENLGGPIPRPQSSMGISGDLATMPLVWEEYDDDDGDKRQFTFSSPHTSQGIGGETLAAAPHTPIRQGSPPPQTPSTSTTTLRKGIDQHVGPRKQEKLNLGTRVGSRKSATLVSKLTNG